MTGPRTPAAPPVRFLRPGAGLALVVLVGLAARLAPWTMTFTADGVRFRSDTDPYYHALRAQRIVADWPAVPWVDSRMGFPYGAEIPWPPLFDLAIASAAKAAGATAQTPELVSRVAALLAFVLGVALLPLVALLGKRLLGGGLWLDAALLVALLPASIRFGAVGAADQHGAELLLSCGIFLAFASGWSREPGRSPRIRWTAPLVLGTLVALAFWTWLGSALYLLLLVGVTGLWHVVAPAGDGAARAMARSLLGGGLVASVELAASIAAFAPHGALARGGLDGLTGLHVAMCAVTAAFGGLLLAAGRSGTERAPWRRLLEAVAAGALSLAPVLAIASLRDGVGRGVTALSHGNPWYASIVEYLPLLGSGARPLLEDARSAVSALGFGFVVMPFALLPMRRRWKQDVGRRPALFFLFVWGAAFLALTLTAARFQLYLVVPLALWVCLALRDLGSVAARRWPAAGTRLELAVPIAGVLLVASPALPNAWTAAYARQQPGFESDLVPSLRWLRDVPSTDPARPSVMAEWAIGHLVQYFAAKPVVATPFGTEEGPREPGTPGGLEDWAAFLFTKDPEAAEKVLARRRAGFVVLRSPKNEVINALGFAPPGTPPPAEVSFDWLAGPTPRVLEGFSELVANRLYYSDGMHPDGAGPALGGFRLLAESSGTEWMPSLPPAHLYKVFGVVPGALIAFRGAPPHAIVSAKARIQTNQDRVFEWATQATAGPDGRATLRLPYATGKNGLVLAGPFGISDGVHHGSLQLDESDVAGGRMDVDLAR